MKPKKCIAPENQKLTKEQLATATYMNNDMGVKLTIGDLTMDQLRVCLHDAIQDNYKMENGLLRAYNALNDVMP